MAKEKVRVTVCGAAETVTGSKYLIESGNSKLLVDCGMFQGLKDLRLRNWKKPPFDPASISAVVLTHAHIDHTGYLPVLVKLGFKGNVFCTDATKELLGLVLPDAAHLQEEEARFANKWKTSKHDPAEPLFAEADARNALKLVKTIDFDKWHEVIKGFKVFPTCAGHILGSASLAIEVEGRRINFSGDVGKYEMPILKDPDPIEFGDLLFCESTYGNRAHGNGDTLLDLEKVINEAYSRGGAILIPAFAVGRTQTLIYYLRELEEAKKIPLLPLYIDSPMAVDSTMIYRKHLEEFDPDTLAVLKRGGNPLLTRKTYFCDSREKSKQLNGLLGPRIIISAGGMVNGGRILHHMRNCLPKKDTTVVFVGYQAEGTRGQQIQSGSDEVKIFGEYVPIKAQVKTVSGLSAHADKVELVRWLKSSQGAPGTILITHGEKEAANSFNETVRSELGWKSSVAQDRETIEL